LAKIGYNLPFRRPWFLTVADAKDVMGRFWLMVVERGLLDRVVTMGFIRKCVWNVIRQHGRALQAQGSRGPLLAVHEVLKAEAFMDSDIMAARMRRDSRKRLERYIEVRHERALELSHQGYSSDEVASRLTSEFGCAINAATVRKWRERDIVRLMRLRSLRVA
jgi:hypothetical protein